MSTQAIATTALDPGVLVDRSICELRRVTDEVHVMPHDRSSRLCPSKPDGTRFDTVTGGTGGSKVYIVYENGRAYPEYMVTYTR